MIIALLHVEDEICEMANPDDTVEDPEDIGPLLTVDTLCKLKGLKEREIKPTVVAVEKQKS